MYVDPESQELLAIVIYKRSVQAPSTSVSIWAHSHNTGLHKTPSNVKGCYLLLSTHQYDIIYRKMD